MCWNMSVSLIFALIHLSLYVVVDRYKPKYYQQFKHFLLFYTLMELLQSLQWYIGVGDINSNICPWLNTVLTVIAYILIWYQPIMFASFISNKTTFVMYYTIITFIVAMINLGLGFIYPATEMMYLKMNGQTNYGFPTCTYMGDHGHLLWKFQINTISYQPTHYIYYSIIILIFFYYYTNELKYTIGFGWILSFIMAALINGINSELPSFWCLLSVCSDVPILIYTLYNINLMYYPSYTYHNI